MVAAKLCARMSNEIKLPGSTFSANLRAARNVRGWTITELARRAGVTVSAVSRLEAGKRQPELPSILALAAGLGMTGSALLEGL